MWRRVEFVSYPLHGEPTCLCGGSATVSRSVVEDELTPLACRRPNVVRQKGFRRRWWWLRRRRRTWWYCCCCNSGGGREGLDWEEREGGGTCGEKKRTRTRSDKAVDVDDIQTHRTSGRSSSWSLLRGLHFTQSACLQHQGKR